MTMTDPDLPLGHPAGPREHWCAKVQIMGSPANNWALVFDPGMIEGFLRDRMATVTWHGEEVDGGETNVRFDYTFPDGWTTGQTFGTARLAPTPGLSFEVLSYGMAYDLLEALAAQHPENTDMAVVFSEFRALFHQPGASREAGIFRLSDAVHERLSGLLFPTEWGVEAQE